MNNALQELVQFFFQKESLQQCSEQELHLLCDKHPYLAASRLLLTQKLKSADTASFHAQLQKTYLFFNNPLQLDLLLNEKGNAAIEQKKQEEMVEPIVAATVKSRELVHSENDRFDSYSQLPVYHQTEQLNEEHPVHEEVNEVALSAAEETVHSEEVQQSRNDDEPVTKIPSLTIEPIDASTTAFSFQPYHTVDYFASQGIKAREEEKPKDKFGQQLKSFTEWLKTIKKTPVAEIVVTTNANSEQKVEQLAQHSLSEPEVITEAMAEVWERQGNREKAIRIYDKLSLLNPSKRSYFAAKIEHLKHS
ncbi:MAG TPA: hypothetical protein VF487_10025 [Chitinophagaceae bacterium]